MEVRGSGAAQGVDGSYGLGRVWLELMRYLDSTVSTRFALVVVVCTAPKENRSGVLVSHVHYCGLSTTRFSRNHEWSRLWVLRLSRG